MTYSHKLSCVAFECPDERGCGVILYWNHFVEHLRERFAGHFSGLEPLALYFPTLAKAEAIDSAGCTLLGTAAALAVGSGPAGSILMWLLGSVQLVCHSCN